jgi:hypothetical protein
LDSPWAECGTIQHRSASDVIRRRNQRANDFQLRIRQNQRCQQSSWPAFAPLITLQNKFTKD